MSSSLLIQAKRLELKKRHKKVDKDDHNSDPSVVGGSSIDSTVQQHVKND